MKLTGKQNQLYFLVTAICYFTYCDLRVNLLGKLFNTMVYTSVVLYSCSCFETFTARLTYVVRGWDGNEVCGNGCGWV